MKTMKDFYGSDILQVREIKQDDVFELVQPDIDRTIAVINYWDGKRQKAAANARLFANSKKVLEAAIQAYDTILFYEKRLWEEAGGNEFEVETIVNKSPILNALKQAINDSL